MRRRDFLAGALACAAAPSFAAAPRRPRLGFQVYGVRDLCERDFPGTLRAARAIGYEGVETGRFYGRSARELKSICADAGLELFALQLYPWTLAGAELPKTIRFAHEAGCRRINVAWFQGSAVNENDWQLLVATLNYAAEVCAKEGLVVAYHNHDHEFRIRFGNRVPGLRRILLQTVDRDPAPVPGICLVTGGQILHKDRVILFRRGDLSEQQLPDIVVSLFSICCAVFLQADDRRHLYLPGQSIL